jgi:hypothetical protein
MEITISIVPFLSFCRLLFLNSIITKYTRYTQFCMEIKRNYTTFCIKSYTKICKITRKFCKIKINFDFCKIPKVKFVNT